MAVWRNRELEVKFGGPLDQAGLTEEALQRLRAEGVIEDDLLDYKRVIAGETPYPKGSPDAKGWLKEQEFAKDVAALANHRGGVLLIGVGEDVATGKANDLTPVTADDRAEEQRLQQALLNHLAPYFEPLFVPIPAASGGWYMAVVVPPSPRAPHAVVDPSDARNPLRYPVRRGRHTDWLDEHEVADRYRRRASAQADQTVRLQRTVEAGRLATRTSPGLRIYATVVPEMPVEGVLTQNELAVTRDWALQNDDDSPLGQRMPVNGVVIPAPGRVTFSVQADDKATGVTIIGTYAELWVDGAAFASATADAWLDPDQRGFTTPAALADEVIRLLDFTLRWSAERSGGFGIATVATGLVESERHDAELDVPVMLVDATRHGTPRLPKTRTLVDAPEVVVTADLGAVATTQQRLVVAHAVLRGLLQHFGLVEPPQIKPDGSLLPGRFGPHHTHHVLTWAQVRDVPIGG